MRLGDCHILRESCNVGRSWTCGVLDFKFYFFQMFPGVQQQPPVPGAMNDVEFEEIMNRNRTVASSAISRAVADAAGGDVKSATETILTAISLIKQSRVAQDDRCRVLVVSLQSKAYSGGGGSSRSKHRDRSRSRSRDRDRKRRRRSRSRSRYVANFAVVLGFISTHFFLFWK
ncbi:unnamed protein product [Haemonchus placei]|uniref:Protein-serine/threonine phosphatase n=1 Tax=Haemonchus placei TaxID=6290 RepID=A0A0N4WYJ7_HAEPC|nr:unnamed protein product [Haemonchus placei]